MDLYLFDFDKTLYAYDNRKRLPALSRSTGVSEYHLAKTWWVGGFETRAEAGEWPSSEEYLAQFQRVTGAKLSLEQWQAARALASTRIPESVRALERASGLGTVSLLSNNPAPFAESLPVLAPDVTAIVGDNRLVSCQLGVRKPDERAFRLALERYGATAENTFFTDDSAENIAGAVAVGIHGHHLRYVDGVPQVGEMREAIEAFANRTA
ncbi:MAG TPA: HAD family phosphatase [Lacisediminihabitans sp.]|uniref:HAD family hydrolase n=1 Tax=Lacisediminihabitans sp. TaxID=2787631 RepID=UPI002EDAEC07